MTQDGREQVAVDVFQANPLVTLQPQVAWPARPSDTYTPAGVVGHAVHVVPTGATEYWPAVQFVHVTSTVVVHAAAPRRVPAGHTVQGLQDVAPAADQLTPAVQVEHAVLAVGVHIEERKLPAAHVDEAQAEQGA